MFKYLRFASLSILSFFILITTAIPISADRLDLEKEYENIISNRISAYSETTTLDSDNLKELRENNVDEVFFSFFEAFTGTNFLDYMSSNTGTIVINEDSDLPILIDGSADHKLRILIGSEEFMIVTENLGYANNLILQHQDGKQMYIHEETFSKVYSEELEDIPLVNPLAAGAYWRSYGPPLKGQTGTWLVVLGLALEASGWIAKFDHTIVGTVLKVVGAAVTVGSLFYVTLYTIIYQSQRSDCRTYIKQLTEYYNYNNYTGYLKSHITYFHGVRPDQAGGACEGY